MKPSKRQTGCRPSGKAGVMSFGASVPLNNPAPLSIGKADDFVRPPLHLITDTSEEGPSPAEVDTPLFCQVFLQMWRKVVGYADQLSASVCSLGGMTMGFCPWVIALRATEYHLSQTADGLRKGAPLESHIEVDDASAAAFGVINPQVPLGIHLEARVAFIPQRRAIHRVGRQPSDGRDAFTFQVHRDGIPLDGR